MIWKECLFNLTSQYTKESLKSYKSLDGYNQYSNGWVGKVSVHVYLWLSNTQHTVYMNSANPSIRRGWCHIVCLSMCDCLCVCLPLGLCKILLSRWASNGLDEILIQRIIGFYCKSVLLRWYSRFVLCYLELLPSAENSRNKLTILTLKNYWDILYLHNKSCWGFSLMLVLKFTFTKTGETHL